MNAIHNSLAVIIRVLQLTKEMKNIPENVVINKDRLGSIVKNYKDAVKREQGWPTPLGIFVSVILCIVATNSFQEVLFLTKDQVALIVYLLGVASFVWLAKTLVGSQKDKAESIFYSELAQNIKNIPDYTVVYIIKLTKDEIPRVLVERKASWNCYFLPYVSRVGAGDISSQNITDFQKTIASYLGVPSDFVSIEHFRDFSLVSEKYSPTDKVSKQFNFDFFFFTIPKDRMLNDYDKSPFKVGGKDFYWMTLDELMKDAMTMEKNGDIIKHLEDNYTEFFTKTQDSFC